MASDVSFEVDLTEWERTVRDIEAHHDDFSGRTFEGYTRGLFRRVIDVIPPPTVGAGRRAVRRDFARGYPRGAVLNRFLRKLKRPLRTAFWHAYFRGDSRGMREILRAGGSPLAMVTIGAFDLGRAMRGYKRGRWGNRHPPPPLRLVLDPQAVDAHVKEIEGHVGQLKGGLIPALRRLGIPVAAYIGQHTGRGRFVMGVRKALKFFDWVGRGAEYEPAMIARLNRAIADAARVHVAGMRKELAGYRPPRGSRKR